MGHCKTPTTSRATIVRTSTITVEAIYRRAVGIDVHRDILVCCFEECLPETQQLRREVQSFGTSAAALRAFGQWVKERQPEIILMESTGVLWRSPYETLEHAGFSKELALVNARDVKAAMGRKTDEQDAARLAMFARLGKFRRSFVPPRIFRDQRFLARRYQQEASEYARAKNRYNKSLSAMGLRASSVFSDVNGVYATRILEAKLFGTDEEFQKTIAKYEGKLKADGKTIADALDFTCSNIMLDQLREERRKIVETQKRMDRIFERLVEIQVPYQGFINLLASIPGIKDKAVRLIFAELCDCLPNYFPDSEHFCSWLGICPGNAISAGKHYSGRTPKGNKWLRKTLIECANGISLSRNSTLFDRFLAYKLTRGRRRAIVAIAHKLARIIFSCLKHGCFYVEKVSTVLRDVCIRKAEVAVKCLNQFVNEGTVAKTVAPTGTGADIAAA